MHNPLTLVVQRRSGETNVVRHLLKYTVLGSSGCKGPIARLENLLVPAVAMGNAQIEKNSGSSNMGKLIKVCASGIRPGQEGLLITGPSSDIDSLEQARIVWFTRHSLSGFALPGHVTEVMEDVTSHVRCSASS
jgi:hypothetical protein